MSEKSNPQERQGPDEIGRSAALTILWDQMRQQHKEETMQFTPDSESAKPLEKEPQGATKK